MKILPKVFRKVLPKIRGKDTGSWGGSGIPMSGCPLEDHPMWTLAPWSTGPSLICWADFGRTIIHRSNPGGDSVDLFISNITSAEGIISASVAYIPTGTAWTLPLCKMIDDDNRIGVRAIADGVLELVQRVGGTWTTVWTSSTGAVIIGSKLALVFAGDELMVQVNDATVHTYALPAELQVDGYAGINQHRFDDAETTILTNYRLQPVLPDSWVTYNGVPVSHNGEIVTKDARVPTETPCMTAVDSPYGYVTTNDHYDDGSYNLEGWKGMTCTTINAYDCWCTSSPMDPSLIPAWVQWEFPGATPMVPTRFSIKPRAGMQAGWYGERNPTEIGLAGVRADGSTTEFFHTTISDWDDNSKREFDVSGATTEAFIGIRLNIYSNRYYEDNGEFHACIGDFHVWGEEAPSVPTPAFEIQFNNGIDLVHGVGPVEHIRTQPKTQMINGVPEHVDSNTPAYDPDDGAIILDPPATDTRQMQRPNADFKILDAGAPGGFSDWNFTFDGAQATVSQETTDVPGGVLTTACRVESLVDGFVEVHSGNPTGYTLRMSNTLVNGFFSLWTKSLSGSPVMEMQINAFNEGGEVIGSWDGTTWDNSGARFSIPVGSEWERHDVYFDEPPTDTAFINFAHHWVTFANAGDAMLYTGFIMSARVPGTWYERLMDGAFPPTNYDQIRVPLSGNMDITEGTIEVEFLLDAPAGTPPSGQHTYIVCPDGPTCPCFYIHGTSYNLRLYDGITAAGGGSPDIPFGEWIIGRGRWSASEGSFSATINELDWYTEAFDGDLRESDVQDGYLYMTASQFVRWKVKSIKVWLTDIDPQPAP